MIDPELCISGVGTLGPFGRGLEALRVALERGEPLARPVDTGAKLHRAGGARMAALVPDLELADVVPAAAARRMSKSSLWAVAAARLAVADAGLEPNALGDAPLSIDLANVFGPSEFTERLVQQFQRGDPQLCSPFLFTDCVANAPAGQVAIALGAKGSNTTWCQREAGQVLALLAAAQRPRTGGARRALCGVVDEMPPVVHAILDRFDALVRPDAEGRETPRPFAEDRNGFLAGEGAAVLLLEPKRLAKRPLAVVRAGGRTFDPSASPSSYGTDADGLATAIQTSLAAADVACESIDAVVCSASGSRAGDALEARVLRHLFPDGTPPLHTPKGVIGEYGSGVLPAAVVVTNRCQASRRRVLVNAFAAGGAAAWVVLEAP